MQLPQYMPLPQMPPNFDTKCLNFKLYQNICLSPSPNTFLTMGDKVSPQNLHQDQDQNVKVFFHFGHVSMNTASQVQKTQQSNALNT